MYSAQRPGLLDWHTTGDVYIQDMLNNIVRIHLTPTVL